MSLKITLCCSSIITLITRILDTFMFRLNMCLDGERNNLPINATFTVLKVVDINEDESFIDIFFKLHCLPPTALGHHQMIFFFELPVTRT